MKSGRSRRGPRGTPPPTKHPTSSLRPRLCRGKIPRKPAQNRSHPATKRQQFRKTEARCAGGCTVPRCSCAEHGAGPPTRAPHRAACPAPCRAALSVASPFALLLPLRAAASKKKQRRASTSTPAVQPPGQGSQPTQTTKRTRPEQQSIGARALPPELLRLTVTPRVPPSPPPPRPAASRRHLRSASLGSDSSRHVRPPLLLRGKIFYLPALRLLRYPEFRGFRGGLTTTSLLPRAQICGARHGVTRSGRCSVLSS